jgi:hypothetical protein
MTFFACLRFLTFLENANEVLFLYISFMWNINIKWVFSLDASMSCGFNLELFSFTAAKRKRL